MRDDNPTLRFALIGAAGYVAPRHMKAIKDVGGELVAALDPHDSVGILDSYFPECSFFTEFERFDRHLEKLRRNGKGVNYVSICSPNYLHDAHCRFALRVGADAICEKPLVLNERNLDALRALEEETGRRVWGLYQLRFHPEVIKMRESVKSCHRVHIDYCTPRGRWYEYSWKADVQKSGGLATNIGCHLFDVMTFLFGQPLNSWVCSDKGGVRGTIRFQDANVYYELSTVLGEPKRLFTIDGEPFNLNGGFTDLHTEVYRQICEGNGIGLEDVRESVKLCEGIRNDLNEATRGGYPSPLCS